MSNWKSTATRGFTEKLPRLTFPLHDTLPEVYVPQSTILRLSDGSQTQAWLWCYLERNVHGSRYRFNQSSLSQQRIKDLPKAVERLSKFFRFNDARPQSVRSDLSCLSAFMIWVDDQLNHGRYESILSDPILALEALKQRHSYLRQRMQANHSGKRLSSLSASQQDVGAIKMMSAIHNREFRDEIETIGGSPGEGVKAPKTEQVAAFMACCQGVFDSIFRIAFDTHLADTANSSLGDLGWQSGGQGRSAPIPSGTHIERLMEAGCMAYAALCIGDSGANLSQIQRYEAPEDMQEQLNNPKRLNLRHKEIKFRAGGKEVPVHLSATTVTRLRSYLQLREALRLRLCCPDIGPMFVQCQYPYLASAARPLGIIPLERSFTTALRRRFNVLGVKLPPMTMQQLRAHKHGKLTKEHNPKVAADMMGTTVTTAIRRYSKITEADSMSEMAPFLASLTSVVLTKKGMDVGAKRTTPLTPIPPGRCEDHGQPKPLVDDPLVVPDCKKTEGCFFCSKYHVHADEEDSIKLMSCRWVLERLAHKLGDSGAAERVYQYVIDRIGALLAEIRRVSPEAHEKARVAVLEEGRLSRYWAIKLQQLHLLGMLSPATSGDR